jgi:hypothetical protein
VSNGQWTVSLPSALISTLADKTYTIEVSGTNSYGNSSTQTST